MDDNVIGGFDYRGDGIIHLVRRVDPANLSRRLACEPPAVFIDDNARLVDRAEANCMACVATLAAP